jgi:iron complex outermembrane receptor protein
MFCKIKLALTSKWNLFVDITIPKCVAHKANGDDTGLVDDNQFFQSKKQECTFSVNDKNDLYFSYALEPIREPMRPIMKAGIKTEKMNDFESWDGVIIRRKPKLTSTDI